MKRRPDPASADDAEPAGAPTRRAFLAAAAVAAAAAACGGHPKTASNPIRRAASPLPPARRPSPPASPRQPGGPAREVDAGRRDRPLVALTFHGQGDPALATALLDAAERAGARVTIFAVGSWLAAHPAMAGRIGTGRHDLANHTQNHRPMAGMTEPAAFREFADCARVLQKVSGSPGHWVRPSGTAHTTPALRAAAARAGYPVCVGYDVDSLDYTDPGPDVVRRRVQQARAGSIVSLHLGHRDTVSALPGILTDLRQRGLRPVTVTELLGAP
ncbi:MAG: polysaccharide deacetylase family protein [Pseudonocardiales bacterium]